MAKQRVVVKIDLRIQRDQSIVFRQQKRIDLDERRIDGFIGRVKRLHELRRR